MTTNGSLICALLNLDPSSCNYYEFGANGLPNFVIEYARHSGLLQNVFDLAYVGEVIDGKRHGTGKGFFGTESWFHGIWYMGRKVSGLENKESPCGDGHRVFNVTYEDYTQAESHKD